MLKNILKNKKRVFGILFLVFLLAGLRAFEETLFYDPFLRYFKTPNFNNIPLPKLRMVTLFFSLGFRYYLNSMISLGILWLLFKEGKIIKFSVLLYAFFGTILMISFFFVLVKFGSTNKMNLFYIRRFIIQPIFLILFVPAFYYQEKTK
ncbi:exosortase F system-associated membrane protein [Flavobacterium aciduliphilum]|uniref:Exosortase F-associated protein n=1 Tax=Flavobacterium aciduliphilum TaxID=1101402 RepID=A0A328YC97_9FLAO|nr:exosortase F system-associated protein [Flavobacterium aciduliphilum]RAR71549.1 exosortase F-associated protein [Flavobacterium aciduliphilum]